MTATTVDRSATLGVLDAVPTTLYIGRSWTPSMAGRTRVSIDPSTEQELMPVTEADIADVDRAVAAARAAVTGPWRRTPPYRRQRLLIRLAELLERDGEEFALIEAFDMGALISRTRANVARAVQLLHWYAACAVRIAGRTVDSSAPGQFATFVRREQVGVVGAIIPWNAPMVSTVWKVNPVLATGCAVVLKPAEEAPLASLRFAALCAEAGVPDGVVNVVTGAGEVVGAGAGNPHSEEDRMTGLIDCDVHNAVPEISALFPYLPERWQDYCIEHGIPTLAPAAYPPRAALSAGPGTNASDVDAVRGRVLDGQDAEFAILTCLYAVQPIHNEDWAAAMATAVNDWQARTWLDRDDRFRASIVVTPQSPERAVEEIERRADDPRFVQVLLLAGSREPLGKRVHWPIYAAAVAAGIPIGIHPGVAGGNPPTPAGWPSTYLEDYAAAASAMQVQLSSLVCEGVFQVYPDLRVVLHESGVTWLPSLLWRLDKNWKGLRREVPWLSEPPSAVVHRHVRLSVAPFDGPADATGWMPRFLDQIGGVEMLLFASDHPHWHDRSPHQAVLPFLSAAERQQVLIENARATYGRGGGIS